MLGSQQNDRSDTYRRQIYSKTKSITIFIKESLKHVKAVPTTSTDTRGAQSKRKNNIISWKDSALNISPLHT